MCQMSTGPNSHGTHRERLSVHLLSILTQETNVRTISVEIQAFSVSDIPLTMTKLSYSSYFLFLIKILILYIYEYSTISYLSIYSFFQGLLQHVCVQFFGSQSWDSISQIELHV